jgi:hypothetical protein
MREIIIAKDIPDELVLAVQRVPGVSLYRYKLAVSVELVSPQTATAHALSSIIRVTDA